MNGSGGRSVHEKPSPTAGGRERFPEPGRGDRARTLGLAACLVPILAGAGVWLARGAADVAAPAAWIAIGLVGLGWGSALALARGLRDSRLVLVLVGAGALALRVSFLASELELSDDVHRYVWEGALVAAGVDPYGAAPDSARNARFQERWRSTFERVNHPEVAAAYPPLGQAVHAAVVAAAGGADRPERARLALRLFQTVCDLFVCLPLAWMLRARGRPLALVVAWAWNPWVAQEFAGSAHLDALAILCTCLALACFPPIARAGTERAGAALALLAAGTATKLLPVALVPFALRSARRPWSAAAVFAATLAACALPLVLLTGTGPSLSGLGEYAFRWESSSLVYRWIEPQFARHLPYDEGWNDPRRLARALVLLVWLGLAVHAWRARLEPARAAALLVGGFLVLTPTLHPWYLTWIVPFLALRPSIAWGALAMSAPLLYWPVARWRAERVWEEPHGLGAALALGFGLLLALETWRGRRAGTP